MMGSREGRWCAVADRAVGSTDRGVCLVPSRADAARGGATEGGRLCRRHVWRRGGGVRACVLRPSSSLRAPHNPRNALFAGGDGGRFSGERQAVVALMLEVDGECAAVVRLSGAAHHSAEVGGE